MRVEYLRSAAGRWLGALLGIGLLLSSGGGARAAGVPFRDVPRGYWAYSYIADAYARGIMVGYDGLFQPDESLTRAQFAKVIDLVLGLKPVGGGSELFGDVPPNSWEFPWVTAAAERGVMEGTGDGLFEPEAALTREDAAVALIRAAGLAGEEPATAALPYADAAQIAPYAQGAVALADRLGLLKGDQNGDFDPLAPLTRAQAAALFDRYLKMPSPAPIADPAQPASVKIFVPDSSLSVGQSEQLTASVYDSDGRLLPLSVQWTATAGEIDADGTFQALQPGIVTVTATVDGVNATATIRVSGGPSAVVLEGLPPTGTAGSAVTVKLQLVDAGGVPVAQAGLPLKLDLQWPGGEEPLVTTSGPDGSGSLRFTPVTAAVYQLEASSIGLYSANATLIVHAASPARLAVGAMPTPGAPPGEYDIMAVLLDKYGNPVGDYVPVSVAVQGPGNLIGVAHAIAPQHDVAAFFQAAAGASQPTVITVTSGFLGGAVTITPAQEEAAASLELPAGATVAAGNPLPVTVNLPGAPDGTPVTLTVTAPDGTVTNLQAATAGGVATFGPMEQVPGTYGLAVQAAGYSLSPTTFTVTAGPPVALRLTATPSFLVAAGQETTLRAFLVDRFGNPTGAVVPVTLSTSGPAGLGQILPGGGTTGGVVGYFAASGATGRLTITASSPGYAPASLTIATEKSRAGAIAGKGLWLMYGDWKTYGTQGIIQRALAAGVTHLYLEVGSTYDNDGFWGAAGLNSLLPAAHRAGIAVIAWIYDTLANPAADLQLAETAANYTTPDGQRPDGLILDLETDDNMTPAILGSFDQQLRAALPNELLIACTYPVQYRPDYPFKTMAATYDAIAPMDYWHVRERSYSASEVQSFVSQSVSDIWQATGDPNMPVEVIGQAFDAFSDSGVGTESPTGTEVTAGIGGAEQGGAIGFSLYRLGTATPDEWQAFAGANW